jgi:hypothetical protein
MMLEGLHWRIRVSRQVNWVFDGSTCLMGAYCDN